MITGAYAVFACVDPEVAEFLCLLYLAMDEQKRLRPFYTGLRKVVQKTTFMSIKVAIPPKGERGEILCHVAAESQRIDTAIATAQREIDLLREYRTRLIADVVTGKLDVREVAARLPDEADEPEPLGEAEGLTDAEGDTPRDPDAVPEEAEA